MPLTLPSPIARRIPESNGHPGEGWEREGRETGNAKRAANPNRQTKETRETR